MLAALLALSALSLTLLRQPQFGIVASGWGALRWLAGRRSERPIFAESDLQCRVPPVH